MPLIVVLHSLDKVIFNERIMHFKITKLELLIPWEVVAF